MCQLSEPVDMHQGRKVIAGPSSEANRKMMILLGVYFLKYHSIKTIKAGECFPQVGFHHFELPAFTEMFQQTFIRFSWAFLIGF